MEALNYLGPNSSIERMRESASGRAREFTISIDVKAFQKSHSYSYFLIV